MLKKIKSVLVPTGFLFGIFAASYMFTSLVEWNIDISEWSKLGRFALFVFAGGIFGTFAKIGKNND